VGGADALDLGEEAPRHPLAGAEQPLGEDVRRDLEKDLGEAEPPALRILGAEEPEAAVAHAQRLADPGAEAEPDLLVRVDVEVELVAIADVAEHPAVEGDDVDGERERRGAGRALDVDQRRDRLAVGVDELADVDAGVRARAVGEGARRRHQPVRHLVRADAAALRFRSHVGRVYPGRGETKSW
jgi:hypothetical protein